MAIGLSRPARSIKRKTPKRKPKGQAAKTKSFYGAPGTSRQGVKRKPAKRRVAPRKKKTLGGKVGKTAISKSVKRPGKKSGNRMPGKSFINSGQSLAKIVGSRKKSGRKKLSYMKEYFKLKKKNSLQKLGVAKQKSIKGRNPKTTRGGHYGSIGKG